jgi:heme/copper-type cytochrome/quinol oxidase subunit 2
METPWHVNVNVNVNVNVIVVVIVIVIVIVIAIAIVNVARALQDLEIQLPLQLGTGQWGSMQRSICAATPTFAHGAARLMGTKLPTTRRAGRRVTAHGR